MIKIVSTKMASANQSHLCYETQEKRWTLSSINSVCPMSFGMLFCKNKG